MGGTAWGLGQGRSDLLHVAVRNGGLRLAEAERRIVTYLDAIPLSQTSRRSFELLLPRSNANPAFEFGRIIGPTVDELAVNRDRSPAVVHSRRIR
jgi:hypothetical protein